MGRVWLNPNLVPDPWNVQGTRLARDISSKGGVDGQLIGPIQIQRPQRLAAYMSFLWNLASMVELDLTNLIQALISTGNALTKKTSTQSLTSWTKYEAFTQSRAHNCDQSSTKTELLLIFILAKQKFQASWRRALDEAVDKAVTGSSRVAQICAEPCASLSLPPPEKLYHPDRTCCRGHPPF